MEKQMFGLDKSSALRGWKGEEHGLWGVTRSLNSLSKWKCLSLKATDAAALWSVSFMLIFTAGDTKPQQKNGSTKKLAFAVFILQQYPKL